MSKTKVIHSQRQPRNLKRMLTNAYFSRLKDTDPEVKICGTKRCRTCPYLKQGKPFTFSAANETFRIKHSMNCPQRTSIYVITWAGCGHNYIGETGDVLRNRVTTTFHPAKKYSINQLPLTNKLSLPLQLAKVRFLSMVLQKKIFKT